MRNRPNDPSGHRAEAGPIDSFKPLIRVGNVTYRIGRLRYGHYEVVRILDEVQLGTFECYPTLTVTSSIIHPAFILSIARAAARAARPSWIYRISHALRRHSSAPPIDESSPAEKTEDDADTAVGGTGTTK